MKDKNTAAFLSLLFGWFGIHQFYLRRPGLGLVFIGVLTVFGPATAAVLGFLNAFILFLMSQESFDKNYNRGTQSQRDLRGRRRHQPRRRTDFERERRVPGKQSKTRERTRIRTPRNIKPPRKKNPYKTTGLKKYKEFDLNGAIEDFSEALEIDPNDVATHFNIACAYSLTEEKEKGFYHLDRAINLGFKDFEKIKKHDDLAFLRIQSEFEDFEKNGFRLVKSAKAKEDPKEPKEDVLLQQLNKLKSLREKGFLTDEEFVLEQKKLMNK